MNGPAYKNRLFSIAVKYGLIGGLLVVFLYLLFYFLGKNPLLEIKYIDLPILGIFIFFALKEFKVRFNDGELRFWQGITGGMITYVTIAVISGIFILILLNVIDPGITQSYIESRVSLLNENKETLIESINEQAYTDALEGVQNTTATDLALDDFLKKSIIGLFLTIIIAVILRK